MADYTCSISNYYNSSNTSGGAGYYFGSKRKVRLTIDNNSWFKNKQFQRAYLSMTISGYYNSSTQVYHYCTTSSAVGTVFPNENASGVVADVSEKPAQLHFYPAKTYNFDITKIMKYAQANYNSTWYIWQFFDNSDSSARKYSAPTITLETTVGGNDMVTAYVYSGGIWRPATPYIYNNGWKIASPNVYSGGWKNDGTWSSKTWPTSSQGKNESDIACASSTYDSHSSGYYKAVCALGLNTAYGWMSSKTATNPWIQVHLPDDAYNLQVKIYNSSGNSRRNNGPLTGTFYYTDRYNMETEKANMISTGVSFTRPDGLTNSASTTHSINNTYPIRNIIISVDTWEKNSSNKFCCIGKLEFTYKYKS